MPDASRSSSFPPFDRQALSEAGVFQVIGAGEIGGKGRGLASVWRLLRDAFPPDQAADVTINIPSVTVLATDVFEQFMDSNNLWDIALTENSDVRLGNTFMRADLSPLLVGDLHALVTRVHAPLAVRSSSVLEDELNHPFAGTYATKMIPNSSPDASARFRALVEAIKLVYASTFFADAKRYQAAIGKSPRDERMAVLIQEVVGQRHGERYYPTISGVMRTFNDYAASAPEEGIVSLALGLGKTIVDGGLCWSYTPAAPHRAAPFAGARDMLQKTQAKFWSVHLGPPPAYDPLEEAEYLVSADLEAAEYDGTLTHLAGVYDPAADRIRPGLANPGPRVLNFAPLLEYSDIPFNDTLVRLAQVGRSALGQDVEIEFAATLGPEAGRPVRMGFLQIRPLRSAREDVAVTDAEFASPEALVATDAALGNAARDDLVDVIYVVPERFEVARTPVIAAEVEELGREAGRPYVLVGFGRWGSSDPWLGIPVTWPQIAGAAVIVEATRPDLDVEPSQGTHFFHNLSSFGVPYLTVRHAARDRIDFAWLAAQPATAEKTFVRHVRLPAPLRVRVDGRSRRGVILRPA
jgi:hypothetical protein